MTPEQVNNLIDQKLAQASAANRFQLTPTNRHIHNNVDAPFVFLPYSLFAGFVPYDGDTTGILESILPKGWTVTYDGTGSYRIFHNLGTIGYTFVANCTQSTNIVATPVVSCFENEVDVIWFDDTTVTAADTSFNFILMQINSKSDTFPTYVTNNVR